MIVGWRILGELLVVFCWGDLGRFEGGIYGVNDVMNIRDRNLVLW